MESTIDKIGEVIVFNVNFEALDARTSKDFRAELTEVLSEGSLVVLDLSQVQFIDSSGLGTIVASLKRLRATNGDMRVCNVHKPVRALFELVRMHKLVDIFASREEALQGFGGN